MYAFRAASAMKMKVPACNDEVPSDWCAEGAHARLVTHVALEEATDGHDDVIVNALVLWFPLFHATKATLRANRVFDAIDEFMNQVVNPCTDSLEQEVGDNPWPWQSFALYPQFERCVKAAVEEQGTLQSYAQVVAIGKEFHMGFSAPLGGLVAVSNYFGDVVMLPTIFEGPGI